MDHVEQNAVEAISAFSEAKNYWELYEDYNNP